MQSYGTNKFKTALEIRRRIENWPAAWGLRLQRSRTGLHLLRFRDGFNVICRGGTRDWDVVHELLFAGGYGRAFDFLKNSPKPGPKLVLDLGGNIGLFSLLAARQSPDVTVHAFEPGPPNYRLFEMNCLANAALANRIVLHREGVSGEDRETEWFFDESNPGGSSLFATEGTSFHVKLAALSTVINSLPGPVTLAKIDIEGAEYELLDRTPEATWRKIEAISLELHSDPRGQLTNAQFLERFRKLGYEVEEETVCSYFLHRR
jgi:FkbM family methyltransferase